MTETGKYDECMTLIQKGKHYSSKEEIKEIMTDIFNSPACSTMFIAAIFIIARSWKEPKCPSTEEWIQKMWYIYTMEYYLAIKNNEFMKFLGKWMELENIILSEVIQSQKNTHVMHSLISG